MRDEFSTPITKQEKIAATIHLYMDGGLNRREMWKRLTRLAGGSAAAMALLETHGLAQERTAVCPEGIKVAEDDPAVEWQNVTYPNEVGSLFGLLARPKGQTVPQPGILVVHENRGLVEHIRDVTRRFAKAGFVALGIDLLSRQGGTNAFPDDTARIAAYGRTDTGQRFNDMAISIEYLKLQRLVIPDRIGTVGFCAGGGNVIYGVMNKMNLQAAVPFYGSLPNQPLPPAEQITTPMLAIYSELDRAQAARIGELANQLVNARNTFGIQLYKGTSHGFHNDTGAVYDPVAACDAWGKTITFLNTVLRAPRA